MKTSSLHRSVLLATVLASAAGLSAQSVIYRETFGATTAGPASAVGWYYNAGTTGAANTTNLLNTGTGSPTGLDNVNAGGVSVSTSNGFVAFGGGTGRAIVWTDEYIVDRSAYDLTSITFTLGNQATTDQARVAVRIGSSWFVSTEVFSNSTGISSAGNFGTGAVLQTFAFTSDASAWTDLSFEAGTTLALGSVSGSALPSGNITAFGIFYNTANNNRRFDTFTINAVAVPEPSSFAALAGLGALGLAATRRRRRA